MPRQIHSPLLRRPQTHAVLIPALLAIACAWLAAGCTPALHPAPAATPMAPPAHHSRDNPSLADFWNGQAAFVMDVADTGLPMGESDTVILAGASPATPRLRAFIHASHQSAGVVDQCGDPVAFPGCMVVYESSDQGRSFQPILTQGDGAPICQIPCASCPCQSTRDHIDQQQYPQVDTRGGVTPDAWWMVYEYRANVFLRRSTDGLSWRGAEEVPLTGIWQRWLMPCAAHEQVGAHPYTPPFYQCLVGSPPGIHLVENAAGPELFVFVGLGRNPGSMGCYRGPAHGTTLQLRKCDHNPLFTGAADYGPLEETGATANRHFDFRTVSSATVQPVGDHYYMLYEGVRGAGPGDAGDTQFALGLARTLTSELDGPWETFPGNPILVDLPGNVGLGHADLVVLEGQTMLFTSLDGVIRSRLILRWKGD